MKLWNRKEKRKVDHYREVLVDGVLDMLFVLAIAVGGAVGLFAWCHLFHIHVLGG